MGSWPSFQRASRTFHRCAPGPAISPVLGTRVVSEVTWSRTSLEAGSSPAPSRPGWGGGGGGGPEEGREATWGRGRSSSGLGVGWARSPAHRARPTMASCGRRLQECGRGSRAVGRWRRRRRPRGGAGWQPQPLTCPGSSHFPESGGARSTCRPARGRGGRRGSWPARGSWGDGAESSLGQGRPGRDSPPRRPRGRRQHEEEPDGAGHLQQTLWQEARQPARHLPLCHQSPLDFHPGGPGGGDPGLR